MTDIINEINAIKQLKARYTGPQCLEEELIAAVNIVHNCLKNSTDTEGWRSSDRRKGAGAGYKTSNSRNGHNQGDAKFFNKNHRNRNDGHNKANNNAPDEHITVKECVERNNDLTNSQIGQVTTGSTAAPTAATTAGITTASSSAKYVSRFKKDIEKVDDAILNNIILGKLNKFSAANYAEIKEFITHIIDSGQNDLVKCFMKLVFQKAASEENFCPLYAKLISELSILYPVLYNEMNELYNKYLCIFINVNEINNTNYSELLQNNIEKKYRRGYSQFLAELLKCNAIDKDIFIKTIDTILSHTLSVVLSNDYIKMVEEYADCLMKIVKVMNSANNEMSEIKNLFKGVFKDKIFELTIKKEENKGLSNKARFTFLDIYESLDKLE